MAKKKKKSDIDTQDNEDSTTDGKKAQSLSDNKSKLNLAKKVIAKKYGASVIMSMGEEKELFIPTISSGSLGLDMALGRGGFARGRIYEFYGPPSGGKCLEGSSIISSSYGLLPISKFSKGVDGTYDLTLDVASDTGDNVKTSYFYEELVSLIYNIENNLGLKLGATPDHKIKILNTSAKFEMKRLEDVKVGDIACICRTNKVFPEKDSVINFKHTRGRHTIDLPENLTPELSRLIGYIIANGSNRGNGVSITTNNKLIRDDVRYISELYNISCSDSDCTNMSVGSSMFLEFVSSICGGDGTSIPTARFKTVPEIILRSTKETQTQFLCGLIDCDSYLNDKNQLEYYTASKELADMVQVMLLNIGVVTTKSYKYLEEYDHNYYKLRFTSNGTDLFLRLYDSLKYVEYIPSSSYHTNIDSIPYLKERLISEISNIKNIFKVNGAGTFNYESKFYRFKVGHVLHTHTNNKVTYYYLNRVVSELKLLPQIPEVSSLIDTCEEFINLFYFFSEITNKSKEEGPVKVYDFHIPDTHLFLSNGFVSHNTTLAMSLMAQAQKRNFSTCFVDAEHTADPQLFKAMGVNIDDVIKIKAYAGEDNIDALETLIKTGTIDVAVVDSVSALIPKMESEAGVEDDFIGLLARLMSKTMRRIVPIASETNTLVVFINQLRYKIGSWGDPTTTTGGEALNFYATGRISVAGGEYKKSRVLHPITGEVIGHDTTFNIQKNKLAPPWRSAVVRLIYGVGYDIHREALSLAEGLAVVEKNGAHYYYEGERFAQGEENAVEYIKANEEFYNTIRNKVIDMTGLREHYERNS
jgi:recombination protein RecA